MPGIVRTNLDKHVGHASPTPNPFHQTAYELGSPDVFINNEKVVRKGDTTAARSSVVLWLPQGHPT